jgi:hypothetical protein
VRVRPWWTRSVRSFAWLETGERPSKWNWGIYSNMFGLRKKKRDLATLKIREYTRTLWIWAWKMPWRMVPPDHRMDARGKRIRATIPVINTSSCKRCSAFDQCASMLAPYMLLEWQRLNCEWSRWLVEYVCLIMATLELLATSSCAKTQGCTYDATPWDLRRCERRALPLCELKQPGVGTWEFTH